MNIVEATKLFFVRYTDFNGRSRRSEYWWSSLSITVIGAIATAILGDLSFIWSLAILVPALPSPFAVFTTSARAAGSI